MSVSVEELRQRQWSSARRAGSRQTGSWLAGTRHAGTRLAARSRDRLIRHRVGLALSLLVVNALTYYGSALHLPSAAGKAITQGALPLMLVAALTVNRRLLIRPNVFLSLVTLLALEAVITTLQPQSLGTMYRTFRLLEFVAGLWLLTPWWGRRDLLLVRSYLTALMVVLSTVVLGIAVMPGLALSGGRLSGVLWDIPSTEVAHYAAIVTGLMVILWMGGRARGRRTLLISLAGIAMLLLSHTRTALIALVAGLLVAGLSMIMVRARVRRLFAIAAVLVSIGIMTMAGVVTSWLARGQDAQQLTSLTGRTDFWTLVLNLPRTRYQEIFGFGLSNGSVNGLPIDSNWLVAYLEQGLFGVVVCAAIIVYLLVAAFLQPASTRRALALFLITYSLVASFTQVGFANPTTYLIELTLAASLLVPPAQPRPRLRPLIRTEG